MHASGVRRDCLPVDQGACRDADVAHVRFGEQDVAAFRVRDAMPADG
jgi:hypothetical protein